MSYITEVKEEMSHCCNCKSGDCYSAMAPAFFCDFTPSYPHNMNAFHAGAIGAHALTKKSEKIKQDWKVATQYQLLHSLALATLPMFKPARARTASGLLFTTGIILFSGSIYFVGE